MRQALNVRSSSVHPLCQTNHAQARSNRRRPSQPSTTLDVASPEDILRNIHELSQTIAMYESLALSLGSLKDCLSLRDKLQNTRKRACDLARLNKVMLLPHIRQKMLTDESHEQTDVEKMWNMLTTCVQLLYIHLLKTLSLISSFPLYSGSCVLIQTGLCESSHTQKRHNALSIAGPSSNGRSGGNSHNNPDDHSHHGNQCDRSTEGDSVSQEQAADLQTLKRDIQDLADMLQDIENKADIKPWAFEPDQATSKFFESRVNSVNSDTEMGGSTTSTHVSHCGGRKTKCVRLIIIVLVLVLVVASVLGVCFALYL